MGDEKQYRSNEVSNSGYVYQRRRESPKPPRSDEDIQNSKNIVVHLMPEFVQEIRELVELGMIAGWRDVYATVNPKEEDE